MEMYICLTVIIGLSVLRMPIAYAIITGAVVYLMLKGQDLALASEQIMQGLYDGFILLAVPLFIVAAGIMNAGTVSERLLNFCIAIVGRFKGGLGHVNVVSSLIFSGMSGSAVADAAGIGKIIIDMMVKDGRYPKGYAAAITAASATIGPIIPPSIPMVMYALISGTSIGYLFLAGIVPGLLMGLVLIMLNVVLAHRRGFVVDEAVPLRQIPKATFRAFPALLMPAILLYGIYGGVTTPTEAAAVAALYALFLTGVLYRTLKWSTLYQIFAESVRSSASVGLVIGAALVLNYIVASENIAGSLAGFITQFDLTPMAFLFAVAGLLLLLGCFLDASTIILVILPIFIPTCHALGIDLVHFGVVSVVVCMLGLITPPYGILLFVISATAKIELQQIIREIWLFLLVLIGAIILMIVFPQIVLWLPREFGYQG